MDFGNAKIWSRAIIQEAIGPGSVAVDATMGNGNDTKWLCEAVGETGRVYAFDIQPAAVEKTALRLEEAGLSARAALFRAGHERMDEFVPQPVDAAVFNLGWLPGAAHGVTTRVETTLTALEKALALLKNGAVMTVCAYPGHEEGARERQAVYDWAKSLNPKLYDAVFKTYLNQPNDPPCVFAVRKKLRPAK